MNRLSGLGRDALGDAAVAAGEPRGKARHARQTAVSLDVITGERPTLTP